MSSWETELPQDAQLHVEIELDVEGEVGASVISKSVGWPESWRSGAPTRGG